ncbi:hypothetical protein GCM10027456_33840 [Kineosporia babensis]
MVPSPTPVRQLSAARTDDLGPGRRETYFRRPLRAHLHEHLFLETYGHQLAGYATFLPPPQDELRWSVRADERRGYLFAAGHRSRPGVGFELEFADRTIIVPQQPVTLPAEASFAWPIRQPFGDIPALTATAQPITEIKVGEETYVLFAATPGIDVELLVEGVEPDWVLHADVEPTAQGLIVRPQREPGLACEVWIGMTTLVFLDEATADTVHRGEVDGEQKLIIWPGNGWFDGAFHAVVTERDQSLLAFPTLDQGVTHEGQGSVFTRYILPGEDVVHPLKTPVFTETATLSVAPTDQDFARLEAVPILLPADVLERTGSLSLRLDWTGDVLRLYAGTHPIAEALWSGRLLEVDLTPHWPRIVEEGLWIKAFAWAGNPQVFVDPQIRPRSERPVLTVRDASIIETRTHTVR